MACHCKRRTGSGVRLAGERRKQRGKGPLIKLAPAVLSIIMSKVQQAYNRRAR